MVKSTCKWKKNAVLVLLFASLIVACVPSDSAGSNSNPPACTPAPTTPAPNGYRSDINPQVDSLYSRLFPNQINYDPNTLQGIKNEAFTLLVERVKRWSSSNDIPVGDQDVIRITLTYISPELAQIIILNHQLQQLIVAKDEFQLKLMDKMKTIAVREELLFLTTIVYSQNSQIETEENMVILNIPVNEMALINAGDRHIFPNHFDPPLEHEIVISRGPFSGYIAFPIWVMDREVCLHVMEKRWNTMLTVNADGFRVKGDEYGHPLTWFIKYHPLIEMDDSIVSFPNIFTAPTDVKVDHQPPSPERNVPASEAVYEYWRKMAIHIWAYVVGP